jgi:hypothetical protein
MIVHLFVDGRSVPKYPYDPVDSDSTCLASFCHEINPSNPQRSGPHFYRDEGWIKEHWLKLKATMVTVWLDFDRSGRETGRDEAEVEWFPPEECRRWIYHTGVHNRAHPDVIRYAYALMEKADFVKMGKANPPGAGRDNGVEGEQEGDAGAANDRRKANKGKASSSKEGGDVGEAIITVAGTEVQLACYRFQFENGGPESKEEAYKAIKRFSAKRSFSPDAVAPSAPPTRAARQAAPAFAPAAPLRVRDRDRDPER